MRDLCITNILHRSLTSNHTDFLLSFLSVLLIDLIYELFHVILMHPRQPSFHHTLPPQLLPRLNCGLANTFCCKSCGPPRRTHPDQPLHSLDTRHQRPHSLTPSPRFRNPSHMKPIHPPSSPLCWPPRRHILIVATALVSLVSLPLLRASPPALQTLLRPSTVLTQTIDDHTNTSVHQGV